MIVGKPQRGATMPDQLAADRKAELERQWAHDRTMTWIAAVAGLVGAVIGGLLSKI